MKFIFIISAKFLILISLLSCGGKSGSSDSESQARAPRYRSLLLDQGETKGTVILREDETEIEAQIHVTTTSLRNSLKEVLILEGPCPATGEMPAPESVRHEFGRERIVKIEYGSAPPPLGGHSVLLASSESPLACGPLVPIPQE